MFKTNTTPKDRIVLKDESYRIVGACFEVYKEMGSGFLECVYQECLAIEMALQGIPHLEHPRVPLKYKRRPLSKEFVPDFLCFDAIIVEIKAVKEITPDWRAQIINYLNATGLQLGLLVNFGHHPGLEHERFVNQPRMS